MAVCHEETLSQVIDRDAFLVVTLSHLDEVLVEAFVLIQEERSAFHLELSWRVLLILVVKHTKCIEFIVVASSICIDATLCPCTSKSAG